MLEEAFYELKENAAPGLDRLTWKDYEADLERNVENLHNRVQWGAHRALPSQRVYIPKPNGRQRPLAVAALEDKIVQRGGDQRAGFVNNRLPKSGVQVKTMNISALPPREAIEFDTVIVGAGPAGLAAAIRVKQLAPDKSVVVVEKGSEVGAHILSGAVIDPIGLDRLIPEWRNEDAPIKTAVTADQFYVLGASAALRLPNVLMPPLMSNHGNFIVSLGEVCRYLARKAEALGVEIYPGFAATETLFENGAVAGIATGDMGVAKDGHHKSGFARGMELRGKYTLFAEGARGSLSKVLIERFGLRQDREPQKFGIGLKELWQVAPD